MAPGLGRLKPDTTGSSHPASDISDIIYIHSLQGMNVYDVTNVSARLDSALLKSQDLRF